MNEYDSSKIMDILRDEFEAEVSDSAQSADILIMNTCSIREKAQEKVFSLLGQWRKLKAKNPNIRIAVGGCVASQEGEAIIKRAPYVDIVFGPQTLHKLPEYIRENKFNSKQIVDTYFFKNDKFDHLPASTDVKPTAFLSIMEGCNKFCSFCVVPYTRGEELSRPVQSILDEALSLASRGVKEINLLGQNVNAYRSDVSSGKSIDFSFLLRLIARIDEIERVRFTTSHPIDFNLDLINTIIELPKLGEHLHLPIQSGSNKVLSDMKRGYSREYYLRIIERLKKGKPNLSLSSDFIVGFPTESNDDFNQTLDIIDQVGFDQSFSFIYSPRPGTPASILSDSVSLEEKSNRLRRVQEKINLNSKLIAEAMIGSRQKVLVENVSKRSSLEVTGRALNNKWVNFLGPKSLIGSVVDVDVTNTVSNSVRGRAVEYPSEVIAVV
jgi:tRNA-2-methylthio-N6-dimethylallyladenosine synthase